MAMTINSWQFKSSHHAKKRVSQTKRDSLCDTFPSPGAGLSQIDGAVATNSGKSLRNSCFFPKTALTLHRRKEITDTTNNIV